MNTPCITVAVQCENPKDQEQCATILSLPPGNLTGMTKYERISHIDSVIREAITTSASVEFAQVAKLTLEYLRKTASDRWDLSGSQQATFSSKNWLSIAEILEMRQGVTPGGALELFLMSASEAKEFEIESDLVHNAIKSKEIERWHTTWTDRVLFYPYEVSAIGGVPAFTIDMHQISDHDLAAAIHRLGMKDALDFDKQIDEREYEIIRGKGVNKTTVGVLLSHRIALGLVNYPKAATYLIQHYERLEGRVFKHRNIRTFNRRWYEYLWPRDPKIMLSQPRIISPSLIRSVRFALDKIGYLSDHACIYLQPTAKTSKGYRDLHKQISDVIEDTASLGDVLNYCLAFLNTKYVQERLITGHRPTPKGFYAVTEEFLREIIIPPPTDKETTRTLLELVTKLTNVPIQGKIAELEGQLENIIYRLLQTSNDLSF